MTRIKVLAREEMNEEQGRVYDEATAAGWPVGGPYTAYIRLPEMMARMQDLRNCMQDGPLSARERQIAHLAIARFWGAKYPWFAQARASLAAGAITDVRFTEIRHDFGLGAGYEFDMDEQQLDVSLNGRPYQPLVDPAADLAKEPWSLAPAPWIEPLRAPFPERIREIRD